MRMRRDSKNARGMRTVREKESFNSHHYIADVCSFMKNFRMQKFI